VSLISIAFEKLQNLTAASKFTAFNGFVYLGLGVLLILWPGAIQTLLREREPLSGTRKVCSVSWGWQSPSSATIW
jgi:hypothetical protein